MKKNTVLLLSALTAMIIFFACKKNHDVTGNTPPPTETDTQVSASIQGRVTDSAGVPVENALVTGGGTTTHTDVNGMFSFKNITVSKYFGFVKVEKTGFFSGSRTFVTSITANNFVTIQLIPRNSKGSFDAAAAGSIQVGNGASVDFTASTIVTASTNSAYSGTVNVFASWLNPTDPLLPNYMPGDLRGVDASKNTVALQTFGMMVVELQGAGGEKLQLESGKTASITFPISPAIVAAAPATIPLWYFNDSSGKWIEEGSATKQGSNYVGTVGHFTYWNCDAPSGLIYFKATVQDQAGKTVPYIQLLVSDIVTGVTRGGYTDSAGVAQGYILKNQSLLFTIVDRCGNQLFSNPGGPFTSDQDLGIIKIQVPLYQSVLIHGKVNDCTSAPVANGFVNIVVDGLQYGTAVTNGDFSVSVQRCSSNPTSVSLLAGDYGSLQNSAMQSLTLSGNDLDAGTISACGSSFDQFINFTINGQTYGITVPSDSIAFNYGAAYTYIYSYSGLNQQPSYKQVDFQFPAVTTGTFNMSYFNAYYGLIWYGQKAADPVSCQVSTYGPVGSYIVGSFSGNVYKDTTGAATPITGNFKVKKKY